MQVTTTVRRAAKAGSWYEADATKLNQELTGYLEAAKKTMPQRQNTALKAVIGPHAGFAYSGPNAAWAYKNIDPTAYDRVLLLGPSHALGFQQIGLTSCSVWKTPLGDFEVDLTTTQALLTSRKDLFIQL